MSKITSSGEDLTLNADGSGNEIKFQCNGTEVAKIDSTGFVGAAVPAGVILMWSGASAAIPSGWNICDGNNSTPNLTGKFIKAATTAGGTGGSTSTGAHTLTIAEMPSHDHTRSAYDGFDQNEYLHYDHGSAASPHTISDTGNTGGGGSHSHTIEPVYYALIYIMKA